MRADRLDDPLHLVPIMLGTRPRRWFNTWESTLKPVQDRAGALPTGQRGRGRGCTPLGAGCACQPATYPAACPAMSRCLPAGPPAGWPLPLPPHTQVHTGPAVLLHPARCLHPPALLGRPCPGCPSGVQPARHSGLHGAFRRYAASGIQRTDLRPAFSELMFSSSHRLLQNLGVTIARRGPAPRPVSLLCAGVGSARARNGRSPARPAV
jgi:hypothetical protein